MDTPIAQWKMVDVSRFVQTFQREVSIALVEVDLNILHQIIKHVMVTNEPRHVISNNVVF